MSIKTQRSCSTLAALALALFGVKMRNRLLSVSLLVLCSTATYSQGQSDAEKLSRALTGDDKGAAINNPQCNLFTKAEAGRYIGSPVISIDNAGGGTGCQWAAKNDGNTMMVQVVPARYYEAASLGKGFRKLPEVGKRGFVVPDMGWKAGSILGQEFIVVNLMGAGASESTVIELLKETMKRRSQIASK
ncbi:MAG: hypothetical protein JWP43_3014 [Ramlibacter sp.]|nr:hypothetical protein [Ramlibacter sp.]